jgi:hypothetical protein
MSHVEDSNPPTEVGRIGSFLRLLAERAERDPHLAAALADCLNASGLIASPSATRRATDVKARDRRPVRGNSRAPQIAPLDPFAIFRAQGETGLRLALDALDLTGLRAVVKAHRLDPAHVASRWTARERVVSLIVEQVKARLNHGRAFERV